MTGIIISMYVVCESLKNWPNMAPADDRSTDRPSTSSPAGTARQVMAKQLRKPVELVLPVNLGFLCLIVKQFGQEKLVDSRAGALQGAALYICSTKKLAAEDIRLMQHVGRSEKANVLM